MSVISIRLTEEGKRILAQRSRRAGMKQATFVPSLIRERPIETGADALADHERHVGDQRMRIQDPEMTRFLLDSSFLIDLLGEEADPRASA